MEIRSHPVFIRSRREATSRISSRRFSCVCKAAAWFSSFSLSLSLSLAKFREPSNEFYIRTSVKVRVLGAINCYFQFGTKSGTLDKNARTLLALRSLPRLRFILSPVCVCEFIYARNDEFARRDSDSLVYFRSRTDSIPKMGLLAADCAMILQWRDKVWHSAKKGFLKFCRVTFLFLFFKKFLNASFRDLDIDLWPLSLTCFFSLIFYRSKILSRDA